MDRFVPVQIGLFVGPAFNLFLSLFHFHIGPLLVDRFTAPGFLMTILWIVFQFVMAFTYYNVDELMTGVGNDSIVEANANHAEPNSTNGDAEAESRRPLLSKSNDYGSNAHVEHVEESRSILESLSSPTAPLSSPESPPSASQSPLPIKDNLQQSFSYASEFSTESLVVLNTLFFISYFVQMTLETMVTPVTEKLFHYGEFQNALFFAIAGVVIFVVCLAVSCLSKAVDDRLMTLVGLVLMVVSLVWIVVIVPQGEYEQKFLLLHFLGACFFDIVGLTIVCITGFSMYTKLVKKSSQGFGMGLRRTISSCGLILGPLWAGSMIDNMLVMLLVVLALLLMYLSMYVSSYGRLRPLPAVVSEREERV